MSLGDKKIAFLGAGNMAEALISGILAARLIPAENIFASDIDELRLEKLKKEKGVQIATSNLQAVEESDILFLAVKPQTLPELLAEIGGALSLDKLIVSIAAGVRIDKLEQLAKKELRLVRVMPNLPALIKSGISALYQGKNATSDDLQEASILLAAVGAVVEVNQEEELDAVTALSGSGPGYLFYFAEALHEAGLQNGLSSEVAEKLAAATLEGASKLLIASSESAAELRAKVTSKGGTTEAAIQVLEKEGFKESIKKAVLAATERSKELSR